MAILGVAVTLALMPEPKHISLEELTEIPFRVRSDGTSVRPDRRTEPPSAAA